MFTFTVICVVVFQLGSSVSLKRFDQNVQHAHHRSTRQLTFFTTKLKLVERLVLTHPVFIVRKKLVHVGVALYPTPCWCICRESQNSTNRVPLRASGSEPLQQEALDMIPWRSPEFELYIPSNTMLH